MELLYREAGRQGRLALSFIDFSKGSATIRFA
jgi:hypothetical protein